jgi:hypothetical protein
MKCLPSTDVEFETELLFISDGCIDRPLLDHSAGQIMTCLRKKREEDSSINIHKSLHQNENRTASFS